MSDRVRFLRYRNDSGEVIVAYKENENIPGFHAGYAFCNPCDFNLPRKVRLAKGHGLATWRMRNYAVPIPPFAPETAEEYTHHMFRKHMWNGFRHLLNRNARSTMIRDYAMSDYPECEKMAAVHEKSQAIGEFLEWLQTGEADGTVFKRPVFLAAHRIVTEDSGCVPLHEEDRYVSDVEIVPLCATTENLLARFFNIDMEKVEKERQAMLDDLRKQNG